MPFDPLRYSLPVADMLRTEVTESRLLPLVLNRPVADHPLEMLRFASSVDLFPGARAPEAALAGLWLYFSYFNEAHGIAQDLPSAEGSYWHGILHRQEPDIINAGYWFRRVGQHAVFEALRDASAPILAQANTGSAKVLEGNTWNPVAFNEFCDSARRRPGSAEEVVARQITTLEWQLLFDYCASPAAA
ncbi:MAG: hypothetical protein H7039_09090 [Bryobacteraceae bacterium]|nr:hypothetical protein [Bryobacteraceae bacterium]